MRYLFACVVLLGVLAGCSKKKEVVPPEPVLQEEDVMPFLIKNVYQVAEWYSVKGSDTAFISRDSVYQSWFVKSVFLQFGDGYVFYYGGYEFPNTEISGYARTFNLNLKFLWGSNMKYNWDATNNRLVIKTNSGQGWVPFLKSGLELTMDASGYHVIRDTETTYLNHQSGTMRFTYEENGAVTTILLKQMWRYPRPTPEGHRVYYVVF
ncbi:hypothetical protein ACN9ML_08435 [Dyadobacter endophyticus]|uniref:hypothetical protein n=1 Tax=Dyadobacter endophyticus TaxID=1749036 RepID=UPI003CEA7E99